MEQKEIVDKVMGKMDLEWRRRLGWGREEACVCGSSEGEASVREKWVF